MDGVAPIQPHKLDAIVEALVQALEAVEQAAPPATPAAPAAGGAQLLAREGLAERLLGETQTAGAREPSGAPAATADPAAETGTAQTFARPQPPAAEAATRPAHPQLPATSALSEFALPAAQLVPTALVGLQVAGTWMQLLPKPPAEPPPPAVARRDDDAREDAAAHDEPHEDDETPAPDEPPAEAQPAPPEDGADIHLPQLLRSLHAALHGVVVPPALLAAAEQWRRGRCVVLACPQGDDPAGAAWAFVLWPRPGNVAPPPGAPPDAPALAGPRVEARLQWSRPPREPWCHARMVKQHHPRSGRQLAPADAAAAAACAVQLGPVLAEGPRRACPVCLRIDAVRRFWGALGAQWSVLLVVTSLPLAGHAARVIEEEAC